MPTSIERRPVYRCRHCQVRFTGDRQRGIYTSFPEQTKHECNTFELMDKVEVWTGIADLVGEQEDFPPRTERSD